MSFDEFVQHWCKLVDTQPSYSDSSSLVLMQHYMRARRVGIPHDEAAELAHYYSWHNQPYIYIELRRRKLERALVRRLINTYARCCATTRQYISFATKYVVEAHRRGATDDELVESVRHNMSRELALQLRQAARDSASA